MSYIHSNWRDVQAWRSEGLPFSTTSNEAVKMFDAVLTQFIGWYSKGGIGPIGDTLGTILQADPDFVNRVEWLGNPANFKGANKGAAIYVGRVMGHVLCNSLNLMSSGTEANLKPELKDSVDNLLKLAAKGGITDREKLHVQAVKEWADGNEPDACLIWEEILTSYPTDMMAIKMAHDMYIVLGFREQLRDSIARVMPKWKPDLPLYSYLHGMYAFGLMETRFYSDAEKHACKGLEMNPKDCWATDAQAHVFEMTGRQDEGIAFLSRTIPDWSLGEVLAGHNYWHWALYHMEKGEFEAALDIYDNEVGKRCKSGALLELTNSSSLLYRLQMEGANVGSRWQELFSFWESRVDDHNCAFADAHMIMCTLGAKQEDMTLKLLTSIRDCVRSPLPGAFLCYGLGPQHRERAGHYGEVSGEVALALYEALELAEKGHFDKAVEMMKPIRYKIFKIGGSNSQRDVFNLFLIHAALQSSRNDHHKFARSLLVERKALKENAPMTDRLIERAMAQHID